MRTALAFAVGFVLLAGIFAGLSAPSRAADMTGAQGGTLTVALKGLGGTLPALDPATQSPADRKVLELVYDSLARVDPVTLDLTPWAATGWSWDNAKNITVTLRTDLKFSSGAAYDGTDVAYALRQYKSGGVSRWQIVVVDPYTLRFDFTTISAGEAGPGLFYTEGLTAFLAWDRSGTNRYSGPFSVQSSTASQLVLAANPYHFSGRPNLDTVTYKFPYTLDYLPSGATQANDAACALMFRQVNLIGWPLLANDLTNPRDCQAGFGGFSDGNNKSLLNPDPTKSVPFVLTAKNPGTDFMYFGFTVSGTSFFAGPPGSSGQMLRSGIYQIVNKELYHEIEPNTAISHSVVNRLDRPWAPDSCAPWTPCALVVEAGTVPAPAPVTRKTDTDTAAIALDQAGLVDRNADGIRETATGTPLVFRIISPSFLLDPRKTTIANDMQFQLSSIGLGVTVDAYDTQAAVDAAIAACSTGCMYVKRYSSATTIPDWLYTMPEILAANDPQVNLHLTLGANAWTQSTRQLHVGHVQHLIGSGADVLPVVAYDTLEAYDFETFSGWMNIFGGINNFWSIKGLRLPAMGALTATVDIFPTLSLGPGERTNVKVTVNDALGQGVGGVTVALERYGVGTFGQMSGTTDGTGVFQTDFTAPASVSASSDVEIEATATRVQWVGTEASASLSLHPAPPAELYLLVNRGPNYEIDSGAAANLTVIVLDEAGFPVNGAFVQLSTDLPGATITPANGTTDAAGIFRATFTAKVKQGMLYLITADVSKSGYEEISDTASLSVRSDLGTVQVVERSRNVPGFEAAYAVGAIAVVFAFVALARRRRED